MPSVVDRRNDEDARRWHQLAAKKGTSACPAGGGSKIRLYHPRDTEFEPSATLARNFCCDAQRRSSATAWYCAALSLTRVPMRRRSFITLLGGAAAWPRAVLAQATARRPLVAFLAWPSLQGEPISTYIRQFLKGMREFGYAEGRDFEMAYRTAEGHSDRLPKLAAELVQLNPNVIV